MRLPIDRNDPIRRGRRGAPGGVRMAKAIAAYGRAMVATVDEDDPESVAAFERAMYPLDAPMLGVERVAFSPPPSPHPAATPPSVRLTKCA